MGRGADRGRVARFCGDRGTSDQDLIILIPLFYWKAPKRMGVFVVSESTLEAWQGRLEGRCDPDDPIRIVALSTDREDRGGGGSKPFVGFDGDGQRWWIKADNNPQNGKVIVSEHIVGRMGELMGAPVCRVAVVEIPPDLEGEEYTSGRQLQAGLTHASLEVSGTENRKKSLRYPTADDNACRHVAILALYDWCWGNDAQWLYSAPRDHAVYSHDHGHYFPGGPNWTTEKLQATVDVPHELPTDVELDANEAERIASRIEGLDPAQIVKVLEGIPTMWPAENGELEVVGWFLERRTAPVAERLRARFGGGSL